MSEKYFPLESLPAAAIDRGNLHVETLFTPGLLIRAGDLQLQVVSANNKKSQATFRLIGVFLQPKSDADKDVGVVSDAPAPIILTPSRKIIKP